MLERVDEARIVLLSFVKSGRDGFGMMTPGGRRIAAETISLMRLPFTVTLQRKCFDGGER